MDDRSQYCGHIMVRRPGETRVCLVRGSYGRTGFFATREKENFPGVNSFQDTCWRIEKKREVVRFAREKTSLSGTLAHVGRTAPMWVYRVSGEPMTAEEGTPPRTPGCTKGRVQGVRPPPGGMQRGGPSRPGSECLPLAGILLHMNARGAGRFRHSTCARDVQLDRVPSNYKNPATLALRWGVMGHGGARF